MEYIRLNNEKPMPMVGFGTGKCQIVQKCFLRNIGEKYGKTPAQVALRFLFQSGISVVPKTSHKNRMKENIDIFDFRLNEDDTQIVCQTIEKTSDKFQA